MLVRPAEQWAPKAFGNSIGDLFTRRQSNWVQHSSCSKYHSCTIVARKIISSFESCQNREENGSGNGFDLSNYDPCSVPNDSSGSDMELEQISNVDSSFQLSLTDEKCLSRISIENDSLIKPGLDTCIRVMVDWSDREHELYDASYLENLPKVFKSGFMVKKTWQEAITLFSCLEAFLKEEPLGPDDMWYCPTCKEHRQATKKLNLWRLPEILVVHLKRFSYSRFLKNKLDTFVSFPLHKLDLSKYVKHKAATPQSHVYNFML